MQFGRVDALQTNALSAELDGVAVGNANRRGVRRVRAGKHRRDRHQHQSEEEFFHGAVMLSQSRDDAARNCGNQQKIAMR